MRPPARLRILILALAALAYRGLLFWDPSSHRLPRLEGWFFEASETSPQIVFAFAALLLWRRRQRLRDAMQGDSAPLPAALFFVPGLTLFLWACYVAAPDLMVASLPLVGVGAALLLFGPAFARVLALPLAFALFAIPAPGVLTNQIVYPMQLWTTRFTAALLSAIGVTALREGDMLILAHSSFEVIETCSGLRSIEILTMLAVAYLAFFSNPRLSRLHAVLLVAAAPALAFTLNGLRVTALVLMPDPESHITHVLQGVILFVGGAVSIHLVDRLLLRALPRRAEPEPRAVALPEASRAESRGARGAALAAAFGFGAMAVASFSLPQAPASEESRRAPLTLPSELDGWKAAGTAPVDMRFLGTVRFARSQSRRYERDGEAVSVFVGYDDREVRNRSLISPKNALPGTAWEVERRGTAQLDAEGFRMQSVLTRSGPRQVLCYYGYRGTEGIASEVLRSLLALDRSPYRRPSGAELIRISTDVEPAPNGEQDAEARIRGVLALLRSWLRT